MEIRQGTYLEGDDGECTVDVWCYDVPEFKAGDVLETAQDFFADKIIKVIDVVWSGVGHQSKPERYYVYQRYDEETKMWEGTTHSQLVSSCKDGEFEPKMQHVYEAEYACGAMAWLEQNYKKYDRLKALVVKGWVLDDADDSKGE